MRAKRRRCLLGLWAFLGSNSAPSVEGLVSPGQSATQQRVRKLHDDKTKQLFSSCSRYPRASTYSSCLAFAHHSADFAASAASDGEQRAELGSGVSRNDHRLKSGTSRPVADADDREGVIDDALLRDDMKLSQLLNELDKRGIRYSPNATRLELEDLLPRNARVPPLPNELSLHQLLDELDRRDIRYPPTASRKELQVLLNASTNANEMSDHDRKETRTERSDRFDSLAELLRELDGKNIRYPPTASRQELEALLRQQTTAPGRPRNITVHDKSVVVDSILHRKKNGEIDVTVESRNATSQSQADYRNNRDAKARSSRMPLSVLLEELDRLDIRYEPTCSRAELEMLLKEVRHQARLREERRLQRRLEKEETEESSSSMKDLLRISTHVATKGVQRLPRKVSRIAASSAVASRITGVAERAARQARRVSRRASDFWNEDEDGIRNVHYEYVSVNSPIDVPAVRVDEDESRRAPRSQRRRSSAFRIREPRRSANGRAPSPAWQSEEGIPIPRRPRQTPKRPPASRASKGRKLVQPVSPEHAVDKPGPALAPPPTVAQDVPALPNPHKFTPIETTQNQQGSNERTESKSQTQNEQDRRQRSKNEKQIYSPYAIDEEGEIEGPFDRIGDFLANSADRMLWGPIEDDNGDFPRQDKNRKDGDESRKQATYNKSNRGRNRKQERRPRYWKDRLAEHVDFALGIHEDGEYYNSWEKQLEEEEARREREGPQFWEQNSKSRRRQHSQRNGKYPVPIWEEDGSVMSFILGRTKSGGKLGVERFLDRTKDDNRMVITFFNSALRAALLVSAYICRWASVRGAIPQPVVTIGVIASFLSARPRYRLRAVLVALVALRATGELIHGYVYGDADWEEDYDEDIDDPALRTTRQNEE